MSEDWLDRNHRVSTETWDGVHFRHYPEHYVPLLGWRTYPDRNDDSPCHCVWYTFRETALDFLRRKIGRSE